MGGMGVGLRVSMNSGFSGEPEGAPAPTVNLFQFSQDIGNGVWQQGGVTVAANNVTAPDATLTAETLTSTTTSAAAVNQVISTVTSGQNCTVSVYFPAGGTSGFGYIQLNHGPGAANGAAFATVDRSSGAVSASQTLIAGLTLTPGSVSDGAGGWRFYVTFPATSTELNAFIGLSDATATRNTTVGKTLPIWQGQAVTGAVPGPIILRTV